MKAHVVENGVVVNTIEVASLNVTPNLVAATSGSIGWVYDGKTFINPNEKTEAQIAEEHAEDVRKKRNALLLESDWTQVLDAPIDQAAWATYRQALRDITAQEGFPHNVTWPTKP